MPAEYDILISFAPISNKDGTMETTRNGGIQVKAYLEPATSLSDWNGKVHQFKNILRQGEVDIFPQVYVGPTIDPDQEVEIITNTTIVPDSNSTTNGQN